MAIKLPNHGKSRLSLWILNHYAAPPDRAAGTRHYELADRLSEFGFDTTVFAAGFNHSTLREERVRGLRVARFERFGRVQFLWLRTVPYSGNGLGRALNMVSYFLGVVIAQLALPRPDVVIGSSVHPLAALAGYVTARSRRVPFVFEIRDLWPQTLIDMNAISSQSPIARILYGIERRLASHSEAVITLLPGTADYFRAHRVRTKKLRYIPNGIDPTAADRPQPLSDTVAKCLADCRADDAMVFGYVGAHGRANGLDVVVDAARLLSGNFSSRIRLLLVGDGPEKQRLIDRAADLGLQNVRFLEPIPKSEVHALLRELDGAIFHLAHNPVFRYGISSNKLFDYLLAGIPVIFAAGSSNDPVTEAHAGISVPPENPSAMASALQRLADASPEARREMGERGRRYVQRVHSIEALAEELAALLGEVLADGGKRQAPIS